MADTLDPGCELLAQGVWTPDKVDVVFEDRWAPVVPEVLANRVAEVWASEQEEARRLNRLLYNGLLCRIEGWVAKPDGIRLYAGPTDYRHYTATNKRLEELRQLLVCEDTHLYQANPLAISVVMRTPDRLLILGRRSAWTMESQGMLHVIAGHVEFDKHVIDGRIDVFGAIRSEIEEELGISEVANLTCLGLGRTLHNLKPELLFAADTPVLWKDLKARPGDEEHVHYEAVPDEPDSVWQLIRSTDRGLVPIGAACLEAYARYRFRVGVNDVDDD